MLKFQNAAHPHQFGPTPTWANIPETLKQNARWCVWEAVKGTRKDGSVKYDKIPYNGSNSKISTNKPDLFLTYDEAKRVYEQCPGVFNGVGVLVEKTSGFVFGDVDGSTQWPDGLPPTYTELSPSGKGLRSIWDCPSGVNRDITKPVEIYSGNAARFVTITGWAWHDHQTDIQEVNGELQTWVNQVSQDDGCKSGLELGGAVEKSVVPGLMSVEQVQELASQKGIGGLIRRIWEEGWLPEENRSDVLYSAILELFRRYYTDIETCSLLCSMQHVQTMAQEHRRKEGKWVQYIWDSVCKARADSGLAEGLPQINTTLEISPQLVPQIKKSKESPHLLLQESGVAAKVDVKPDEPSRGVFPTHGEMVPYQLDSPQKSSFEWLFKIVDKYIYIKTQNKYLSRFSGMLEPTESFNKQYNRTRQEEHLKEVSSVWYHSAPNVIEADEIGWKPYDYERLDPLAPYNPSPDKFVYEDQGVVYANLYKPPRIKPALGTVELWLDLLEYLIPDTKERLIVTQWLAYLLRYPSKKVGWQIIWKGRHRNGKDSAIRPISMILGESTGEIRNEDLDTGWGDFWAKKKFITIQEVYQPQNKKFENQLKVTAAPTNSGYITYNLKGGSIIRQANLVMWIGFTNHDDAAHLDPNDKRYFIIDSDVPPLDGEFYNQYHQWLDNGGAKAVMHYLMYEVSLDGFTPNQLPYHTPAYLAMSETSRPDWVNDLGRMLDEEREEWELFDIGNLKKAFNQNHGFKVTDKVLSKWLKEFDYIKLEVRGRITIDGKLKRSPWLWCHIDDEEGYRDMKEGKDLYNAWQIKTINF